MLSAGLAKRVALTGHGHKIWLYSVQIYDLWGKPAKTLHQLLGYNAVENHSRILLESVTGHSHQLRVHSAYIGHPIIGDKLYHPNPASKLNRLALHASYLAFVHLFKEEQVVLESEVGFSVTN